MFSWIKGWLVTSLGYAIRDRQTTLSLSEGFVTVLSRAASSSKSYPLKVAHPKSRMSKLDPEILSVARPSTVNYLSPGEPETGASIHGLNWFRTRRS